MPIAQQLTDLENALARTLRAERAAAGLTQDRMAERAGLARMVYIRLETGERHATVAQLAKIAEAHGTTPARLLQDAERRMVLSASVTTSVTPSTQPRPEASRTRPHDVQD